MTDIDIRALALWNRVDHSKVVWLDYYDGIVLTERGKDHATEYFARRFWTVREGSVDWEEKLIAELKKRGAWKD